MTIQKNLFYLDIIFDSHLADHQSGDVINVSSFELKSSNSSASLPRIASAKAHQSYSNLGIRFFLDSPLPSEANESIDLTISYNGSTDLNLKNEEDYYGQSLDELGSFKINSFEAPVPGYNSSSLEYLNLSLDQLDDQDLTGWLDIQLNESINLTSDSVVEINYTGSILTIAGTNIPVQNFNDFASVESDDNEPNDVWGPTVIRRDNNSNVIELEFGDSSEQSDYDFDAIDDIENYFSLSSEFNGPIIQDGIDGISYSGNTLYVQLNPDVIATSQGSALYINFSDKSSPDLDSSGSDDGSTEFSSAFYIPQSQSGQSANNIPVQIGRAAIGLSLLEDSETTSFGFQSISVSPGINEELTQGAVIRASYLPDSSFGQIGLVDSSNSFIPLTLNTTIEPADLERLAFKPAANATGSSQFIYKITDYELSSTFKGLERLGVQDIFELETKYGKDINDDSVVGAKVESELYNRNGDIRTLDASGNIQTQYDGSGSIIDYNDGRYVYQTDKGLDYHEEPA